MSNQDKCLGAELPKFYIIQYRNVHTTVAIQMLGQYMFKVAPTDSKETTHIWRSVDQCTINKMIDSIDQSTVDQIKSSIQSADKSAIRLLIVCSQLFKAPHIFDSLLDDSKSITTRRESVPKSQVNVFSPLHITDLRRMQSIDQEPWKLIYINKLLKSRGLPTAFTRWDVVISPRKYIFDSQSDGDVSIRLIQLHKALEQVRHDTCLTDSNIYQLSKTLNESIGRYNFGLPDICLHFQYEDYEPTNLQDITRQGLLLIANLARVGVVNNCAELSNLGMRGDSLVFKSYEHAILSEMHGVSFDFQSAQSTLNLVYKKSQPISSDPTMVFNCMVMYDVIRLMISIQRQADSDQKTKARQIMSDANSIMKQVYDSNPEFKHKKSLMASIAWLYEKHFGQLPECPPFIVFKDYDANKYSYLLKYSYQFDFNRD